MISAINQFVKTKADLNRLNGNSILNFVEIREEIYKGGIL